MVSAIISLILGVLSLISAVPVVLPVVGLALGINALFKEKKKADKKKAIMIIATIAVMANGFVTLMFVIGTFLK